MIRPFTALCFCAFAGAGAWLYGVKHSVALQDRELREIRRETEAARERITVLRAEWALLNEPERLRTVAQRHLQLEPMQPTHFVRDMERRLPVAVAFAGPPDLFAPPPGADPARATSPVMLASAAVPAGRPTVTPAAPPPRSAEGAQVAEAPAPQALAAAVAAQRAEGAARAPVVAAATPAPAARPATAPRPAPSVVAQAAPRPIQPAMMMTPVQESPRVTRTAVVDPPVTSVFAGSSLGRPMLAPPVPVGAAQAATLSGTPGLAPPMVR